MGHVRKRGHRGIYLAWALTLALGLISANLRNAAGTEPTQASGEQPEAHECVILLHGLGRSHKSMSRLAEQLSAQGYLVNNVDYPSTEYPIETLAAMVIPPAVSDCVEKGAQLVHFVTHSMGGIIVRYALARGEVPLLGRVVMLSPPNQGSEVVDKLHDVPGFTALNGPAGGQLGTESTSVPITLGPVTYEVGVITGSRSINPILSMLIPGEDDGKVSVTRAPVEGMVDFLVLPHTHPFIMRSDDVIEQTLHFLRHGNFMHASAGSAAEVQPLLK